MYTIALWRWFLFQWLMQKQFAFDVKKAQVLLWMLCVLIVHNYVFRFGSSNVFSLTSCKNILAFLLLM